MRENLRIYNYSQANFLYQEGCIIENIGYNKGKGKPYINFKCDELFDIKMEEWKNKMRERRSYNND